MCPDNPALYLLMGFIHHNEFILGIGKSSQESLDKGIEMAQKALAMDDSLAHAHGLLSLCYLYKRDYDKAIAEGERAVALEPTDSLPHYWYALILTNIGRPEEAIPRFQRAIRLNPFGPSIVYAYFGIALRNTRRFEEAVSAFKKALQLAPDNIIAHINLAGTYSLMGRQKEAHAEAQEVLRLNPKFTLEGFAKMTAHKNRVEVDRNIDALRKAGLK